MGIRRLLFLGLIDIGGAGIVLVHATKFELNTAPWTCFALLAFMATAAQFFKIETPPHQQYNPTLLFQFAALLLLPPLLFDLLIWIAYSFEWFKRRLTHSKKVTTWYGSLFNINKGIVIGLIVRSFFLWWDPLAGAKGDFLSVGDALLAALTYILCDHFMIGTVTRLNGKTSFQASGVFNFEWITIDFVMLSLGFVIAILMQINLWLVIPGLTPLYLVYRGLAVPNLKIKANTDGKTGLWNAEYFKLSLGIEINRARRFNRHLTVVIADLDFLRNINNTYGHLGGDAVLIGVAEILKEFFREYDLVARFGGEEFGIIMPEVRMQDAFRRIEAVRRRIQAAEFQAPTTHRPIKVTMSFGITEVNDDITSVDELIHQADVAVYEAKRSGRNRTKIYTVEAAHLLGLD